MFSDKLNFLMEITGTKASVLSKACALDASHISRLRRGTRALPKHPSFVGLMSDYFARHMTLEYQRQALREMLGLPALPEEEDQLALLLAEWMLSDSAEKVVEPLLRSFISPMRRMPNVSHTSDLSEPQTYYYGLEGKREAVLQFFSMILKEEKPQTLYLFSDESMAWLYEDPVFAARWTSEFTKVLMAGNQVKIVHNIGRNFNELLEAVAKWVPVYRTGMIEPYYYPQLRDGVFQRTLFIAPNTCAIASSSVTQNTEEMLNFFLTDKAAISALIKEYRHFLDLCKPLMCIYRAEDLINLEAVWESFFDGEGEIVHFSPEPGVATMPEAVAEEILSKYPNCEILRFRKKANELLLRHIEKSGYIMMISKKKAECQNSLSAGIVGAVACPYTEEEYRAHRKSTKAFAKQHRNFRVRELGELPSNLLLLVKEYHGVIMIKTDDPLTAFYFTQPNMVSAFWNYLQNLESV